MKNVLKKTKTKKPQTSPENQTCLNFDTFWTKAILFMSASFVLFFCFMTGEMKEAPDIYLCIWRLITVIRIPTVMENTDKSGNFKKLDLGPENLCK